MDRRDIGWMIGWVDGRAGGGGKGWASTRDSGWMDEEITG